MTTEQIFAQLNELVLNYAPKLIGAIAVWIIGNWIIKAICRYFSKVMEKRETDESLRPFLKNLVRILLKVLLLVSVWRANVATP